MVLSDFASRSHHVPGLPTSTEFCRKKYGVMRYLNMSGLDLELSTTSNDETCCQSRANWHTSTGVPTGADKFVLSRRDWRELVTGTGFYEGLLSTGSCTSRRRGTAFTVN